MHERVEAETSLSLLSAQGLHQCDLSAFKNIALIHIRE